MKIAVGSEHAGADYGARLARWLRGRGFEVREVCESESLTGYPAVAEAACLATVRGDCALTILICGTGIGMCMAAGKIPGVRAALCATSYMGKMAKMHNNANVLVFGSRVIGFESLLDILETFLDASYEGGRHEPRLADLARVEQKYLKPAVPPEA